MKQVDKNDGCNPARWREGFPVEWDEGAYVTRREMGKVLTFGSLTISGANVIAAAVPRLQTQQIYPRMHVISAREIAAGESRLFRYPTAEDPCILLRDQ